MKQKNLAMLGVAVGCGLVAAVAVAKLRPVGAGARKRKVLVAKKDLPVQTKLDEKDLDNLLVSADMPKNLVPPDAVTGFDQVKGKSLNRTLKQGNPLSITDSASRRILSCRMGSRPSRSRHAGRRGGRLRQAGRQVDIMYVERTNERARARAAIILKDMLVLAVNRMDTLEREDRHGHPAGRKRNAGRERQAGQPAGFAR